MSAAAITTTFKKGYKMKKCDVCSKRVKDSNFAWHMYDVHMLAGWMKEMYPTDRSFICSIPDCKSDLKIVLISCCYRLVGEWDDDYCRNRICYECKDKQKYCPSCKHFDNLL